MSPAPTPTRCSSGPDLGIAALELLRLGYAVFPCGVGVNHPLRSGWQAFASACDARSVADAWANEPAANLGIATGRLSDRLIVVDLDPRHGGTIEALAEAVGLPVEALAATRSVRTPSGGLHLHYRWPDGAELPRNSAGKLALGIDVRGVGGLVVGPPSTRPDGCYSWVLGPDDELPAILEAPAELVTAIEAAQPRVEHVELPVDYVPPTLPDGAVGTAEGLEALDRLAHLVAEALPGTRNDTLARMAFVAGQFAGAGHLLPEPAIQRLAAAIAGADRTPRKDFDTTRRNVLAGITRPRVPEAPAQRRCSTPKRNVSIATLRHVPGTYTRVTGDLEASYAAVERALRQAEAAHLRWVDERRGDEGERRKKVPPPPPLLLEVGTGVGKTSAVAKVFRDSAARTLYANPWVAEAQKMAEAIGGWRWLPRHLPTEMDDPTGRSPDGTCEHLAEFGELTSNRHYIASVACRDCANGAAAILGDPNFYSREASDRAHELLAARHIDSIRECGEMHQIVRASTSDHLTATFAAISHGLTQFVERDGPTGKQVAREDRLIIADESGPLSESVAVSIDNVTGWREQAAGLELGIEAGYITVGDEPEAALTAVRAVRALLDQLAAAFDADDGEVVAEMFGELVSAAGVLEDLLGLDHGIKTPLERGRVTWAGADVAAVESTLRVIREAATSVELGTARWMPRRVSRGGKGEIIVTPPVLQVQVRTAWGEAVSGGNLHRVHLDATPSELVRNIVGMQGGKVVAAVPPQHVQVTAMPGRTAGRGMMGRDHRRVGAFADRVAMLHARLESQLSGPLAILTNKPAAEALRAGGLDAGWWGMHERAHNTWTGRNLLIYGLPLLSPDAMIDVYNGDRHVWLLAGGDPEAMPAWDGTCERIDGFWTPTIPAVAAWWIDYLAAQLIQALGRLRGARADQVLHAFVVGPWPLELVKAVERAGYVVTVQSELPPEVGPDRTDRALRDRAVTDLRIVRAMIAIAERGAKPTTKAVRDELGKCGNDQASRVRRRIAGRPLAEVEAELLELVTVLEQRWVWTPPPMRLGRMGVKVAPVSLGATRHHGTVRSIGERGRVAEGAAIARGP